MEQLTVKQETKASGTDSYYFLVSLITPATQDLFLSEDCPRKLGEGRGKSDLLRKVVLESLSCIKVVLIIYPHYV